MFLRIYKILLLNEGKRKTAIFLGKQRFWRRRRDLNPCASCPTYSLSRGAPSPLGYFSMVNICCSILFCEVFGGGEEIRTLGPFRDH